MLWLRCCCHSLSSLMGDAGAAQEKITPVTRRHERYICLNLTGTLKIMFSVIKSRRVEQRITQNQK